MSDYISRDEIFSVWRSMPKPASISSLTDAINRTPAADVEPVRHGRWERSFEDYRQQLEGDKCSVCGFEYYGTGIRRFHYCPNCGAKMDLEGETNDD